MTDYAFVKAEFMTETDANGGRRSYTEVTPWTKLNLFRRVENAQRLAGITRYYKEFFHNKAADNRTFYNPVSCITFPTPASDRAYMGLGTHDDDQGDIVSAPPLWTGCGTLAAALSGGETSVQIAMENNDFEFVPGGYIYIADQFMTGQTVNAAVLKGQPVYFDGAEWVFSAPPVDNIYPYGTFCGSGKVMTFRPETNAQMIQLPTGMTADEQIGTGDGSDTTPTISDLVNVTNGLMTHPDYRPVITATCGGAARTVTVGADGTCAGYCSAGQLNMATGAWTTPLAFSTAPDNGTAITCTYYRKIWTYSGNTVTVELAEGVAAAYATANTCVSGCIHAADLIPSVANLTVTSAAGTFNSAEYPIALTNLGTVRDFVTVTFTSATVFTVSGLNQGSLGTGSVSANFSPQNASAGSPFFTIDKNAWGGTWAAGNTLQFESLPSDKGIWYKYIVPAGTEAEANNFLMTQTTWE